MSFFVHQSVQILSVSGNWPIFAIVKRGPFHTEFILLLIGSKKSYKDFDALGLYTCQENKSF